MTADQRRRAIRDRLIALGIGDGISWPDLSHALGGRPSRVASLVAWMRSAGLRIDASGAIPGGESWAPVEAGNVEVDEAIAAEVPPPLQTVRSARRASLAVPWKRLALSPLSRPDAVVVAIEAAWRAHPQSYATEIVPDVFAATGLRVSGTTALKHRPADLPRHRPGPRKLPDGPAPSLSSELHRKHSNRPLTAADESAVAALWRQDPDQTVAVIVARARERHGIVLSPALASRCRPADLPPLRSGYREGDARINVIRDRVVALWKAAEPGTNARQIAERYAEVHGDPINRMTVRQHRPADVPVGKRAWKPDRRMHLRADGSRTFGAAPHPDAARIAQLWRDHPDASVAAILELATARGIESSWHTIRRYRPADLPPRPDGRLRRRPEAATRTGSTSPNADFELLLAESPGPREGEPTPDEIKAITAEIKANRLREMREERVGVRDWKYADVRRAEGGKGRKDGPETY